MSEDEDCGAWVALSEVSVNARLRDAIVFLQGPNGSSGKKNGASSAPSCCDKGGRAAELERLPAALTWEGAGVAAGLPSAEDGDTDGEGLVIIGALRQTAVQR